MINQVIGFKLKMSGMTQANLARLIGTSPTQLGGYLKGQGSLTEKSLNKSFEVLEINVDRYKYLYETAQQASAIFKRKNIAFEQVMRMNKRNVISETGIEQIRWLIDVNSEKDYEDIINSKIIDYQFTFPYFMTMVVYFMNSDDKITAKSNARTWSLLFGDLALGSIIVSPVNLLLSNIGTGISAAIGAVGGLALSGITKEDRPLAFFKEFSKKIIKNFN